MLTPWGEALDKNAVLQEYPRPQLVRESYYNLNGLWDYAITASDACPGAWDGEILVPFSPEAPLSGVGGPSGNSALFFCSDTVIMRDKGRLITDKSASTSRQ